MHFDSNRNHLSSNNEHRAGDAMGFPKPVGMDAFTTEARFIKAKELVVAQYGVLAD